MIPGEWILDGICSQVDPELWFAAGKGNPTAPAKAICRVCPARTPCAEWAIGQDNLQGVWGGTSERDRGKIRSERRRAVAA